MPKRVLLIATVQSHIGQFHKPLMKLLKENGWEVHVAARDNLAEKDHLQLEYPDKVFNIPFHRSPFDPRNLKAYRMLKKQLHAEHYDVIHCNTPVGGILGRLAAQPYRKRGTQVYYTAHGFHFYKGAPRKNWFLYYPIEKLMSLYTDKLILISDEDYQMAKQRGFHSDIYRIHSVGINSNKYHSIMGDEKLKLRREMGFTDKEFICICTGELNKNKNQLRLIDLVPSILKEVPTFILLLAGNGPERENLEREIRKYHLEDSIKLLGYRRDLERYVLISDVAASMSIREGLGINLIEAMACGKPVIAADNRGHREFVKTDENGFLIPQGADRMIVEGIIRLVNDPGYCKKLGIAAERDAQKYLDKKVSAELAEIYFDN